MARKKSSDGFLFKSGVFALLAGLAFWLFNMFGGEKATETTEESKPAKTASVQLPCQVPKEILPLSTTNEIVCHTWYCLSYDEDHEQAVWVAYELTREHLNETWAERPNTFRPDPDVRTESATPRDYTSSGFDKGHLCPAADMAFDEVAIDETFFMSNISPQVRAFNGGVWRELEELTRDWARKFKRLYVVTGPVLTDREYETIGFCKVSVPDAFYKVLYAPEQMKAIAFILPNMVSDSPIMDYACSIDKVEKLTGLDFFPEILNGLNEELEGSLDKYAWPINNKRQETRIKVWNVRR
ncbi:MAG: DNA/RNA non-specific endonuclease [Lewinellaceae bacterium]|nr:DNA/RNA non-specific endonuclease [Saprospiraceae bacterium]MCB9345573.1 DNA/RNA non-specific endonuclease [Lewinellaceae bacterium]